MPISCIQNRYQKSIYIGISGDKIYFCNYPFIQSRQKQPIHTIIIYTHYLLYTYMGNLYHRTPRTLYMIHPTTSRIRPILNNRQKSTLENTSWVPISLNFYMGVCVSALVCVCVWLKISKFHFNTHSHTHAHTQQNAHTHTVFTRYMLSRFNYFVFYRKLPHCL